MAKKKYEEANIQAIAGSIREKTGTEKTYKTKDMAEGVGEVFEVGKKSGYTDENLAWFNMITGNGKRTTGARLFNECNLDEIVLPKPITGITMAGKMFYNMPDTTTLPPKEMIDLSSVDVATSSSNTDYSVHHAFGGCSKVKYIPDYGIQAPYQYYATYASCRSLEEIELVRSNENTKYINTFVNDTSLTTIHFEGVIGTDFDIHYSPLTPTSFKSVVKHLKNYSGIADHTRTLTVKASAWEALEAEGLNNEDKDWLISLMPYVEDDIDFVAWATVVDFFSWNLVLA